MAEGRPIGGEAAEAAGTPRPSTGCGTGRTSRWRLARPGSRGPLGPRGPRRGAASSYAASPSGSACPRPSRPTRRGPGEPDERRLRGRALRRRRGGVARAPVPARTLTRRPAASTIGRPRDGCGPPVAGRVRRPPGSGPSSGASSSGRMPTSTDPRPPGRRQGRRSGGAGRATSTSTTPTRPSTRSRAGHRGGGHGPGRGRERAPWTRARPDRGARSRTPIVFAIGPLLLGLFTWVARGRPRDASASRPRRAATRPCTTPSRACRTGSCSTTGSSRRCAMPSASGSRSR